MASAPVTDTTLYRLSDANYEASGVTGGSVSLLVTGAPNSFLYAFGGREWVALSESTANACGIVRSIPGFALPQGSHDAPVTTCDSAAPAIRSDPVIPGAVANELARPPSGASVALTFPSASTSTAPATPTSVAATRVFAASRFRTSSGWPKPVWLCALEAFPTGTGEPPSVTELVLSSHYSESNSLGLFGIVYSAAASAPPTAGLAAGTFYGPASRFASANLATRTVSIFELVRTPVTPDGPLVDPQRVEKRLVTSFLVGSNAGVGTHTQAIMVSPDAASQDCGSIAVCFGALERLRGASPDFPEMPVLTHVLTFGIVAVTESNVPTYGEVALPLALPHGLAALQASLSSYANTLAVVSASSADYTSDLALTLYIEAPRAPPASIVSQSQQREWVPAQRVSLSSATLTHPMVAYALAPTTGAGLSGENPSFFGFSFAGMSDSALAAVVFTEIRASGANLDIYVYRRRDPPTPPASLKFEAHHASASMPALFTRVLSQPESVYVREYAAWLTAQANSAPRASGEWRLTRSETLAFGAVPVGGRVQITSPNVADDARVVTVQFATNMDFSSSAGGETLDQILPKNFFEIGGGVDGDAASARRGPTAIVTPSAVGEAALDPGAALLAKFEYLV